MRGRVMALWAVAFLGSTPIGGPVAGWVAETFGGRAGLALGAAACLVAVGIGALTAARIRRGDPPRPPAEPAGVPAERAEAAGVPAEPAGVPVERAEAAGVPAEPAGAPRAGGAGAGRGQAAGDAAGRACAARNAATSSRCGNSAISNPPRVTR